MISKNEFRNILKPISEEDRAKRYYSFLEKQGCYQNPDGTWSSDGSVRLSFKALTKIPVKFEEVKGDFSCDRNLLTSLEGSPKKVGGRFDCHDNSLTSLWGAPKEVGGFFDCTENYLTTLEGAPKKVGGYFHYDYNPASMEELKKTVKRDYL